MLIFSHNGKITPQDDKTNIKHTFSVPKGAKSITVKYAYSPKDVENLSVAGKLISDGMKKYNMDIASISSFLPVHNLVTLSFDENGKYRGACHRQPNEQTVVISSTNSTPGIINRPVENGEWDIVLNVHFAGCDIDYSIEIEAEVE